MNESLLNTLSEFKSKKVIKSIRSSFIVNGIEYEMYDHSPANGKNEDKLYKDPILRRILPRGLCVIKVDGVVVHIVTGICKFGYDGDYEMDASCEIVTKQFVEKENGQCGHVSAFYYGGCNYLVFGSKMVHLIARTTHLQEDIASYTEKRYTVAVNIANKFVEQYSHTIANVTTFCISHGVTLVCEAIFKHDQHIVDYHGTESLKFFAITCVNESSGSLTWCNPSTACEHFQQFGLDIPAKLIVAPSSEWKSCEDEFRYAENSEGAVVYCLDLEGNVVYIYKDKNCTYIFWRAVREQLRNRANTKIFVERLNHPQFKDLSGKDELIIKAVQFRSFFFKLTQEEQTQFFSKWNDYYTAFEGLSQSEKEALVLTVPLDPIKTASNDGEIKQVPLQVIVMISPPGGGKTTTAKSLEFLFNTSQYPKYCKHLEQDMFVDPKEPKKAKQSYNDAIATNAYDPNIKMLILAKVNHTCVMRQETRDILNKTGRPYHMVYIVFQLQSAEFYVERINERGMAHRTLRPSDETFGIICRFLKEARANLLTSEEESTAIYINPRLPKEENLRQIVDFLATQGMSDIVLDAEMIDRAFENVSSYEAENLQFAMSIETTVDSVKKPKPVRKPKPVTEKVPLYDALVFSPNNVMEQISSLVEIEHNIKNTFHLTIEFYPKGKPLRTDLVFGEQVSVIVIGYVSDEKAMALVLDKGDITAKLQVSAENPHITFALADGVKPFYSNELIKKSIDERTVHMFTEPVTLVGTIERH